MRALVVTRTRVSPPPEMMPMIVQGFVEWRERFRDRFEAFYFFASADGGCGIVNVADENELFEMTRSWPLTPYSDIQLHTLIDGDQALEAYVNQVQAMAEARGD